MRTDGNTCAGIVEYGCWRNLAAVFDKLRTDLRN